MGKNIKGNGNKINNMGWEKKNGKMELHLKVIILIIKKKDKDCFYGLIIHHIKVILLKICFKEEVLIVGETVGNMKGSGLKTKCTDLES